MKKNKKAKGFSLMEVMLAGFLLTFGVVAAISLLTSSLKVSLEARNHDIAVLLAQEGVELVRSIRDNNWASNRVSFNGISTNDNCRIDVDSTSLLCGGNSKALNLSNDGFYKHGGGTATKFSRKIIVNIIGNTAADITSMVVWGGYPFPPNPSYGDCNLASHCAFTQITLSKWGEY